MPIHNRILLDKSGAPSSAALLEVGAFFSVEITVPKALAASLAQSGSPVPQPQTGMALVDTGATRTCVHEPILQAMGLNPTGTAETGTARGPATQNVYKVDLIFPGRKWEFSPPGVISVDLTGQQLRLRPNPEPVVALLGRDFLQIGLLVWNGPGGLWSFAL